MRPMRKASRQKSAEWALEVFDKAPFVTVSMTRPDGTPYGLPLSLVRRDGQTFYFHCASEGENRLPQGKSLGEPVGRKQMHAQV